MSRRHPEAADRPAPAAWSTGAEVDSRKVYPSGLAIVPVLVTTFIKLLLLVLLFPIRAVHCLLRALFRSKPKEDVTVATVADIPTGVKPLELRPYDLVLIGATGFTGRLAALYLARKYGTDVKWAIAGPEESKLKKLRDELKNINNELKNLPIIVADVTNDQQLPAITNESRVVLTTAGPFELYGHSLVRSCALYGTSYCDTTGEFPWVRKTVDQFDDVARHTGARIVHFCGCDCVPADLLAQEVANALNGVMQEHLCEINLYYEFEGGFSGGTVATMSKLLLKAQEQYDSHLGYDPLVKDKDGKESDYQVESLLSCLIHHSPHAPFWRVPFVMSPINFNCFRRSNALNGYGESVKWNEAVVFPNLFAAASTMADQLLFFCTQIIVLFAENFPNVFAAVSIMVDKLLFFCAQINALFAEFSNVFAPVSTMVDKLFSLCSQIIVMLAEVFPNVTATVSTMVEQVLFFCTVALCKLLSFLLPKPGEGPSDADMAKGFLKLTAYGRGNLGGVVMGVLIPDDMGYSSTGRMLVEAGLALLKPGVSTAGGVFTPASCQGSVLLKRLMDTGCVYYKKLQAEG